MANLNLVGRQTSDSIINSLFEGKSVNDLTIYSLSSDSLKESKFEYENGERTDNVAGYSISLHIMGFGNIDVKIENPNLDLSALGIKELTRVKLIGLSAVEINNRRYFKAEAIQAAKKVV